ncbi:hypothetical protein FQR65_LT19320 [Abscondita terminalis]|nr:hypothetical protein FQR65_LT19320 [Abscondita terminalis]
MYLLVKFVEDDVYYVCGKASVKISCDENVQAKWIDGQFYSAKIIAQYANKYLLNELKRNIECNLPIVVLSSDDVYNYSSLSDIEVVPNLTTESEIFLHEAEISYIQHDEVVSDIITVESEVILHNDDYARCSSELRNEIDNTEIIVYDESNIVKSQTLTDVQIEFIDQPSGSNVVEIDSWIDSQCDLFCNMVNEIPQLTDIDCHTEVDGQQTLNDLHLMDYNTFEDNFEDVQNINSNASGLLDENRDTFQSTTANVIENNENDGVITSTHQKKKKLPYNRDVVETPSFTLRTLQNDPAAAVSSAAVKKRRYFCIYCKQLYAKFPQHLQISHRDQPAVRMFMRLPPKNPERKKIIETIRRRGDFLHNVSIEYNSGELFVARRSHSDFTRTVKDYLPCPHCAAYFMKDTLRLHVKSCTPKTSKNDRTIRILSRTLLSEIHPRASDILRHKIFPVLRDDDCVHVIRYDILVILFGNHLCSKYSSQHHHDMIRNKLRSIGRLLLAVKHYDSTVKDFATLLTPEKFDVCVSGIKEVGGLSSNCTTFKAPTTVLTLSTICKQAAEVWKSECIKNGDMPGKQRTEDFLTLFKVTFPAELGNTAIENRVQQQRQKLVELPVKDDIQILVAFLRRNRREWFAAVRNQTSNLKHALQELASFTLVSLMVFNRRRPENPERKKIIETIRRRGDFLHNVSIEYNSGELFVARRSHSDFTRTVKDYLPCPHCAAYFMKDTLRLHVKSCTPKTSKNDRTIRILSRTLLSEIHPRASDILRHKIFPVLRDDDCVHVIRYDILVILFGNHLCSKYSSQHHHDMIRNKLRSIGRLLLAVKHYDSTVKDFATLLTPEKFDVCVSGIKEVGGLSSNCTTFKAPTTVLTLSTICKQAAEVWKSECIKNGDMPGKQRTEDFLTLFKVTFPAELGNTAIENRVQQQRQKLVELPVKDDIQILVAFLRRNRREWFAAVRNQTSNLKHALQELASFTLVSLMVFNRRRPGELERITIQDFSVLKFADSALSLSGHLKNSEELMLARKYKRFEIRGKLNRTVPVLVDFEIEACINLIIEKREEAGISSANPYVFACISTDNRHKYLRAYFLLRTYAVQCGAKKPNLLRATQLRKHIATECALNDLADNEIRDVANFMGHAIDIHNNIYRRPVEKRDVVQMSQILEKLQGNDDLKMPNEDSLSVSRNETISETGEVDGASVCSDEEYVPKQEDASSDTDEEYVPKRKKMKKHVEGVTRVCGLKTPWTTRERTIAFENFKQYIEEDRLPSMDELLVKLSSLKELNRSPTSVKAWISNELQRRRNPSKDGTNSRKSRWTESMKAELTNVFGDHFANHTLPSNSECAIAIVNCREYQHLTVAALKTAVANEQKRRNIKHSNNSQLHGTNSRKSRWTESMKAELTNVFGDHFANHTLPSNSECAIAIVNCREYQHLTVAALKTAVANEQKRRNIKHSNNSQLRKIWKNRYN